jgi:hypothetical protein
MAAPPQAHPAPYGFDLEPTVLEGDLAPPESRRAPRGTPEPEASALRRPRVAAREPPSFGHRAAWARDLALIGGVIAALLPFLTLSPAEAIRFAVPAAVVAALSGAALGAIVPSLFSAYVRRLPIALLLGAGFGLGALWGALAGLAGSLASDLPRLEMTCFAGQCGALVLGSLWVPYLLANVRGRATWPLVALACVVGPTAAALVWLVSR